MRQAPGVNVITVMKVSTFAAVSVLWRLTIGAKAQ